VQGVAGYVIRRLLLAPLILLFISVVTFSLGRWAPGDYVDIQAGPRATPETVERIKEARGLNDPVYDQYFRYLRNFVQGDLGTSVIYRGVDVEDVIFPRIWVTLQYNIVVLILTFSIGIPVGIWAAIKRGTWMDPLSIGTFLLFASIPVVVSIPLLQWLFAVKLSWLPTGGWNVHEFMGIEIGIFSREAVLPILILTLPGVAGLARYMRSQVLEVLDQDYVRTARSKGLRETEVVARHVARNALLPIVTIMGFELAALTGGSIFVETFLGIPGIGRYAFETIGSRDYDSMMAIVLLGSAIFITTNLIVDIAYGFIDPRIRLSGGAGSSTS
jgi:ABC-type dipeptide/oligopeptide/nickel transport system permease component